MVMNPNDLKLLLDLWKWKLLSTKALWIRHGNQKTISNLYYKLIRLENQKYIRPLSLCFSKTLWTLHKPGFELIQSEIPEMESVGYKSEHIFHDHLVTAFHLGEWVQGSPQGVDLISEQQLRRLKPDLFPKHFPKSRLHRSDGYWHLQGNKLSPAKNISLEVERNPKSLLAYQRVFDFYDEEPTITQVLWLITSNAVERRLKSILASTSVIRKDIHFLLTSQDFFTHGWRAKAQNALGTVSTPQNILIQNQFKIDSKPTQNQNFKSLLDLRKAPINSSTS